MSAALIDTPRIYRGTATNIVTLENHFLFGDKHGLNADFIERIRRSIKEFQRLFELSGKQVDSVRNVSKQVADSFNRVRKTKSGFNDKIRSIAERIDIFLTDRQKLKELKEKIKQESINLKYQKINMIGFVESCGYYVDENSSTKYYTVMRKDDDQLAIFTDEKGRFKYCGNDGAGDIFDLMKNKWGFERDQVIKGLAEWLDDGNQAHVMSASANKFSLPVYGKQIDYHVFSYRNISETEAGKHAKNLNVSERVFNDPRFSGCVQERFGNYSFCLKDKTDAIRGSYNYYACQDEAEAGNDGVWKSNNVSSANKIVITGSPVVALQHASRNIDNSAYIAFGINMSNDAESALETLIADGIKRGAKFEICEDSLDSPYQLFKVRRLIQKHGADFECTSLCSDEVLEKNRKSNLYRGILN